MKSDHGMSVMAGATETIASFIARTSLADLPPETVEKAKKAIADTFAVILAGAGSEVAGAAAPLRPSRRGNRRYPYPRQRHDGSGRDGRSREWHFRTRARFRRCAFDDAPPSERGDNGRRAREHWRTAHWRARLDRGVRSRRRGRREAGRRHHERALRTRLSRNRNARSLLCTRGARHTAQHRRG